MFPPGTDPAEVIRTAWAAHGMSVVELERKRAGAPLVLRQGGTGQPPDHRRHRVHASTARPPAPRCCGPPRTRPAEGARHHEQLRRRHDAVGHRALGRGELQPVLQGDRDRPQGEALRPGQRAATRATGARSTRAGTPPTRGTPTSPTGSAGSSRSTPPTRGRRRSSTPRWAASSTRAPTSSSTRTAAWWPTWATTSGSTTSTGSSRATSTAPGGTARDRRHNLRLLSRRRPVGRAVHRRRPRATASATARRVDPAHGRRPVGRAGLLDRGGARLHPAGRGRRPADQDGPPRGRRAQPASTAASTSRAPTTPPRQPGPTRARPSPTRARPTRTATSSRSSPAGGDHTASHVQLEPAAHLRRPQPRPAPTSVGTPGRCRRSRAPTTWPSTARATCGSPPTASPAALSSTTGCSRCPLEGPRARPGAAVPRRARRRRDLWSGHPRQGPVGLRRRPAPR